MMRCLIPPLGAGCYAGIHRKDGCLTGRPLGLAEEQTSTAGSGRDPERIIIAFPVFVGVCVSAYV